MPLQPERGERTIHRSLLSGKDIHYDMWIPEVLTQCESLFPEGMAGRDDTYEHIAKQYLGVEFRRRSCDIKDQVKSPRLHIGKSIVVPRDNLEVRSRRCADDTADEIR